MAIGQGRSVFDEIGSLCKYYAATFNIQKESIHFISCQSSSRNQYSTAIA
jgi:hypothetical protein